MTGRRFSQFHRRIHLASTTVTRTDFGTHCRAFRRCLQLVSRQVIADEA